MKHIRKFESFKESRKNSLKGSSLILEDDKAEKAAPAQSQSEKEILAETPEEKKTKIEDILAKHFPEAKGKLDVDDSPNADSQEGEKKEGDAEKKEGEGEKKEGEENAEKKEGEEGEKTNEGAILLAITVASLIPAAMEAVGSITNMLKQKFGVNLDEKQMESLKKVNDARAALEKILKAGKGKFLGKEYTKDNWFEIPNTLSKEIGQPDAAFGKGYDDGHGHGHAKPAAPAKPGEEKAAPAAPAKPGEEKPAAAPVKESAEAEAEQPKKGEEAKEQLEREIAKMRSLRDKLFGSNFAKWMKEKGHDLHHAYTSPIRLVLRGIAKVSKKDSKLRDEAVREKVANIIYAITMVGLAGYGIMSTLSHMAGVGEVAQLVLKGTEAGLNTSEIRKQALTAILGA